MGVAKIRAARVESVTLRAMPNRIAARVPFSERDFYLAEFRGRTLAMALPQEPPLDERSRPVVIDVLRDLAANGTRVILLGEDTALLSGLTASSVLEATGPGWVGRAWRQLQKQPLIGVVGAAGESLPLLCSRVALELKLAKLVWIGSRGVLWLSEDRRRPLVHLAGLAKRAEEEEREASGSEGKEIAALLREIEKMVSGGVASVSACLPEGLADELFTYAGSGTFYSPEGYIAVRSLALDEFDAAENLIARGVEEGFLLPRSEAALEVALTNGFGAFVEGRYLAGIGALLPHVRDEAGEIASLYALTRFVGEGVGKHLIEFAVERGREHGFLYVFACTTLERVEHFFVDSGFRVVSHEDVPESKWQDYSDDRKRMVRCLRFDLV